MSIESERDLLGLMKIGRVVGLALNEMRAALKVGMTTYQLDAVGGAVFNQHGARSAPIITYQFPGQTCVSIDDEAAHGIPGQRVIQDGDLVKIDVSAELDGYYADAALTVPVGTISADKQNLIEGAQAALNAAIAAARDGQPLNAIGKAAETVSRRYRLQIVRELAGHGVGRGLHEEPRSVLNFYVPRVRQPLHEGLVLAIEPHLTVGNGKVFTEENGWTITTNDHKPVANFEHTIVVTNGQPLIVTALP